MIVFCFIMAFACLIVSLLPSGFDWETKQAKQQRLTLALGRALRHYAQTGKSDSLQYAQCLAYELRKMGVNLTPKTETALCGIIAPKQKCYVL